MVVGNPTSTNFGEYLMADPIYHSPPPLLGGNGINTPLPSGQMIKRSDHP